jgi:type 1 glutamine amidotransferase
MKILERLIQSRRNSVAKATGTAMALAAFAIFLISCSDSTTEMGETVEPTKIVFISGVPSHPSGQHEFKAGTILLARALEEQSGLPVEVAIAHHGWPEDESIFDGAKAVIIYSDGNARHPVNEHEAKMDELVSNGVGLMCMHYGVEVPKGEQGEYFKKWIGGHYEAAYSANPHWTAEVELNADHPISRGVPGFSANDEWYYNMRWATPKSAADIVTGIPTRENINRYVHWNQFAEKLLGTKQTMMWAVERPDGGRGIGFTGGHWHRNWAIEDFRKVVLNAIIWVAGVEVPESGVSSEAITEAQLNENLDEKNEMIHVASPSEADLTQPAAKPVPYKWPGMPKP